MIDFLIIGHGLAGACLAFHLDQLGRKVHIVDTPQSNISSIKAAGLYNPITGRKMVKTWMADELFPYLEDFYDEVEDKTNASFLHKRSIYRPFVDIQEQNDWMGRSSDDAFSPFIEKVFINSQFDGMVKDPFGGLLLKNSGYLDIPAFLSASREYWQKKDVYFAEKIDHSRWVNNREPPTFLGNSYGKVIFCEGPHVTSNPFFDWLPIHPLKGEILEISPRKSFDIVLNRGVFVFEHSHGRYKVGSTYNRYDINISPTPEARKTLMEKLNDLIYVEYDVERQYAGIRPTVVDRRPILGMHPKRPDLGVFNGLGTKGVSLGPYFAKQFSELLENGKEVAAEVHISRFFDKFIN